MQLAHCPSQSTNEVSKAHQWCQLYFEIVYNCSYCTTVGFSLLPFPGVLLLIQLHVKTHNHTKQHKRTGALQINRQMFEIWYNTVREFDFTFKRSPKKFIIKSSVWSECVNYSAFVHSERGYCYYM